MFKEKSNAKWNKRNVDLRVRPHPTKLLTCEKKLDNSLSSEGNHQQPKVDSSEIEQGSHVPAPEATELGSYSHVALTLESRIQKKG